MARTTYNPWRDLRHREHIRLERVDLPGDMTGYYAPRASGRTFVLLDLSLDRAGRRAVLAHELAHDERGGGCDHPDMPDSWRAVVAREEAAVERIARNRLIPPGELAAWLAALERPVEAWEVAEEWDVPVEMAVEALRSVAI
jgi:hypothetical protein